VEKSQVLGAHERKRTYGSNNDDLSSASNGAARDQRCGYQQWAHNQLLSPEGLPGLPWAPSTVAAGAWVLQAFPRAVIICVPSAVFTVPAHL
jgi:hypothetical protein